MPHSMMDSPSAPAVELSGVTKAFAEVVAVDDLSLSIKDGEFFSLLGPSGCGKTTTLRMIAGFEQPSSGEVFIKGQGMTGIPPYRRPVNTVFQNYALFPHMTVYENVAFGLEMKKVARAEISSRVGSALELVHLQGMDQRKPKQLSGGQQQRVALARALINRPQVLLLDEPLGALDLKLRKAMQLELKQIQAEVGITFIYVTHDQEEALTMSDRIAVMNQGLAQQVGTPKAIYEHPFNRFVADFIGETNFIDGIVDKPGDPASIRIGDVLVPGVTEGRQVAPNQRVTLAIRPEKITLVAREEDVLDSAKAGVPPGGAERSERGHVILQGRVGETIYIGTDTRYLVHFAGDSYVYVRMQNLGAHTDRSFEIGDEVLMHWLVDNAQVLVE